MRKAALRIELDVFDEFSARKLATKSGITLDALVEDMLVSFFSRRGGKHLSRKTSAPATKAS